VKSFSENPKIFDKFHLRDWLQESKLVKEPKRINRGRDLAEMLAVKPKIKRNRKNLTASARCLT
jgi:hypothetical protein